MKLTLRLAALVWLLASLPALAADRTIYVLLMHDEMFQDLFQGDANLKALIQALRQRGNGVTRPMYAQAHMTRYVWIEPIRVARKIEPTVLCSTMLSPLVSA